MGLGKRALLYLTRKRGKTLILFLLLLVRMFHVLRESKTPL